MNEKPTEVVTANLIFIAFWLIVTLTIWIASRRWQPLRKFGDRFRETWKPAAVIALLFLVGTALGGRSILNPYAIAIFCQAIIGLTLAENIPDLKPLPVYESWRTQSGRVRITLLTLLFSVLLVIPSILIGTVGIDIGRQIFGETSLSSQARETFPQNFASAFFLLLTGAGIAEETTYRLVVVTFFWSLTRKRWLAIVLAAIAFGAYHLSPINSMYEIFRQFPISQFLGSTLIGLVWGYVFVKRGFETAVLSHTLSNWLPFIIFSVA